MLNSLKIAYQTGKSTKCFHANQFSFWFNYHANRPEKRSAKQVLDFLIANLLSAQLICLCGLELLILGGQHFPLVTCPQEFDS